MKADWLIPTRGWHISLKFPPVRQVLWRYGQFVVFFLTLILLFLWYNSLQSHLANYLNNTNPQPTEVEITR